MHLLCTLEKKDQIYFPVISSLSNLLQWLFKILTFILNHFTPLLLSTISHYSLKLEKMVGFQDGYRVCGSYTHLILAPNQI